MSDTTPTPPPVVTEGVRIDAENAWAHWTLTVPSAYRSNHEAFVAGYAAALLANTEATARADERQRVVEECCAAMCARCASGEVAEYREASKNWCHDVYVCRANPIRRALGEEG